jgi:hypothetical protein
MNYYPDTLFEQAVDRLGYPIGTDPESLQHPIFQEMAAKRIQKRYRLTKRMCSDVLLNYNNYTTKEIIICFLHFLKKSDDLFEQIVFGVNPFVPFIPGLLSTFDKRYKHLYIKALYTFLSGLPRNELLNKIESHIVVLHR